MIPAGGAHPRLRSVLLLFAPLLTGAASILAAGGAVVGILPADLHRLRSVADLAISPDAARVAYVVRSPDGAGPPASRLYVRDLATGRDLPTSNGGARQPRFSPDGRWLAWLGQVGARASLLLARADGSGPRILAPIANTNHPLPATGRALVWSADSTRIAFVSATAGPEPAPGDPLVITRYLYKPPAAEAASRFNDNRRLHVFVADRATGQVRQLTEGPFHEHSIDWSPAGEEVVFASSRETDERVFNDDLFAVDARSGKLRRLTQTKSAEYMPVWSPEGAHVAFLGTRRDRTSSETTMEDTHVWVMDADGGNPREAGAAIDNRQGPPGWSGDGRSLLLTIQERGDVRIYRLPLSGPPEPVVPAPGAHGVVTSWAVARDGTLAYALSTEGRPSELFLRRGSVGQPLTDLNGGALAGRDIAPVEAFTFPSFDGTQIEAFLTRPRVTGGRHAPLIVMIHGGPHAQQGAAFDAKAQAYASRGWASLKVNYRGSTGYGQSLANAIFGDQDGGEARDVLAGVDAALGRFPWLDRDRLGIEGGSYGGQVANWIVTRTDRFKAAIPSAGIANLVSFNYLAYYHDYLAVEFGRYPHEDGLMDLLWERSPLRYVAKVRTPMLLLHGEDDNDVPIAEAEQLYIALKDVGVETVLVRYPREGHGLRETGHVVDALERSIAWYERHFAEDGRREGRTP